MIKKFIPILACVAFSVAGAAYAAEHEVHMLNKGTDGQTMVFEPAALKVAKGDTIKFIPTDKSHNVEAVKDMVPAGAEVFKGKVNEEVTVTLDVPGTYVVKCTPHIGMGMAAVIVVDDASANLDAVKAGKLPKKAKERVDAALASLGL